MWSALENAALRESLPAPLAPGDLVHDILVSRQLEQTPYDLHYLGYRQSKQYLLKQFYSLDTNAFLRWQNEARFLDMPPTPGFIWPVEEWRGGLIFQFVGGITLRQWLRQNTRSKASRLCLAARIAQRIQVLHESGIAHRWISPDSIVIVDDDVLLTNFGNAKYDCWDDFWTDSPKMTGDKTCSSPEMLNGRECGFSEDIYGLGALLHIILAGKPPFDKTKQFLRKFIPNTVTPDTIPSLSYAPAPIRELAQACMDDDPGERPTIGEASEILTGYCENAGLHVEQIAVAIIAPQNTQPEKVMVFIKDDPKAITLFDQVIRQAEIRPSLFLIIGLIPNNLPSGHMERFKGSLFRKIALGLSRCREAGLPWSLRILEGTIPEVAARTLIDEYRPDRVLLGRTRTESNMLMPRRGFEAHLRGIDVPIDPIA